MEIRGIINKDGNVECSVRAREALRKLKGKPVRIVLDDRESDNLRRFFEGAVVPYWFYQHPHSGWKTFRAARENLKLLFNPMFTTDVDGMPQTVPASTMMSTDKWHRFLERARMHCEENGLQFPDHQEYHEWEDTMPSPDAIYPPLLLMVQEYYAQKGTGSYPQA